MKVLFDQGTPAPLRRYLSDHSIDIVYERGWSTFSNGELIDVAEQEGYQILITTDQNLRYQQNLTGRQLAIIVLLSTSWPRIRLKVDDIQSTINTITLGAYVEIPI